MNHSDIATDWASFFKHKSGILRHLKLSKWKISIFNKYLDKATNNNQILIDDIQGYRRIPIAERNTNVKFHMLKLLSDHMVLNQNNINYLREAIDFARLHTKTSLDLLNLRYLDKISVTNINAWKQYFDIVLKERTHLDIEDFFKAIQQNFSSIDQLKDNIPLKLLIKHIYSIDVLNYLSKDCKNMMIPLRYTVMLGMQTSELTNLLQKENYNCLFESTNEIVAYHLGMLEFIKSPIFQSPDFKSTINSYTTILLTTTYHEQILKTEYPVEWSTYNLLNSMNPEKSTKELVTSLYNLAQTYNVKTEPLPELI